LVVAVADVFGRFFERRLVRRDIETFAGEEFGNRAKLDTRAVHIPAG
jgi:hypothetical protein